MINYTTQRITRVLGVIALIGLSGLADAQMNWSPAGPVYTAGRSRNMIVDKTDATGNTLYVGSTSSGIFKSIDGGTNWAPLNDQGTVRNISYMAQAADGTIYASTGEGFLRLGQKAKAQVGTGLYKLSGNSLVSVVTASDIGTVITRVACDPNNSAHMALATNKGILVSTNIGSGNTFNLIGSTAGIVTGSLITGQDVKFDGNGVLYCSAGNETGVNITGANTTSVSSKVYKSTDANLTTFFDITPTSSFLADANYGRIELAIAPSNNDVVYASCSNKNVSTSVTPAPGSPSLKALFVIYNATSLAPGNNATWGLLLQGSAQIDPLSNGGSIASGDYAHIITVNPSNYNQLLFGGYSFYIFTRTGGTDASPVGNWIQVGESFFTTFQFYLHENIHDIKIVPGSPVRFYFVTDAGIYRSIDMVNNITGFPSFQPFYKGLVTGQFNSVSIERFPSASNTGATTNGSTVTPYSGFIGGTGGNGLTYYSGTYSLVSQETSYLGGEVYNAEYSKILNGAAILTTGSGGIYRTANAKTSNPTLVNINSYSGVLSKLSPSPAAFSNTVGTTGTPFRLWENYGQRASSPDSAIFYNDTLRFQATMSGIPELTTKTTFTFSAARPNRSALIDSIVVRTGTVVLPITPAQITTAFTTGKDITIKLIDNYSNASSLTVLTGTNIKASGTTGPINSSSQPTITLDNTSLLDNISVTFTSPPFAGKTQTSAAVDNASYYRVFATVFYKYNIGDTVGAIDNSISTKINSYNTKLTKPLKWGYYTTLPRYVLNANVVGSIPNPTYVLTPGYQAPSTNPSFTVSPIVSTTFVINQIGSYNPTLNPLSYTLTAKPINTYTISAVSNSIVTNVHTINAVPNGAISNSTYNLIPGNITQSTTVFTVSPSTTTNYTIIQTGVGTPSTAFTYSTVGGYTYVLNPGNVTQTATVFTVNPVSSTQFTITQSGTGTLTNDTYSTVSTSTYVLNPGNVTQSTTIFVVSPTVTTTYTVDGISSNTLSAPNTTTLYTVGPDHTITALPLTYIISAVNSIAVTNNYILTALTNSAISNSTYNLQPDNITQSTPVFTVSPFVTTNYTITQSGSGTLTSVTFSTIGGYTYVLNPGSIVQPDIPAFTVTPSSVTNYTITQSGNSTSTADTYSTVSTTTYVLNPGNIAQSTTLFVVTPTITTTYTVQSLSSNPLAASNTATLYTFLSAKTTSIVGTGTMVPFSLNNPYVKMKTNISSRLAFIKSMDNTGNLCAVVVSKNPLALNDPLNIVRVSQSGCYRDDAAGNPTNTVITIPGKPIIVEWSKNGTELYYATDDSKLYRVSHINDIFDLSQSSNSGKFYSDVFNYVGSAIGTSLNPNPVSPYRTTLIGNFDRPITSISVSQDDKNLAVIFNGVGSGTTGVVMYNVGTDARKTDATNINWVNKDAGLQGNVTYCSLMEKSDSKKVFVGTDNGMFYTSDITSGTWNNVNNNQLPNVQIFDIEQQTIDPWDCYNSGQIYVATNGRGVWTNNAFFAPYTVGVQELEEKAKNQNLLSIYPNPSYANVTVAFNGIEGETATIRVLDISGRIVKTESLGKLSPGDITYTFDTSDLNAGVYIVNVQSNAEIKRVAKLIVAK